MLLRQVAIVCLLCCLAAGQDNGGDVSERTKELQAEHLSSFLDAYAEAIGKIGEIPANKTQAFFLIPSMNGLWKGNKLVQARFSDAVGRLWRVPGDSVRKFDTSVTQATQEEVTLQSALLGLVQIDRLFTKTDLSQPEFDRFLHRINITPIAAIQQWATATNRGRLDALIQLTAVDDVYPKEQFSVPAFTKVLSEGPKNR